MATKRSPTSIIPIERIERQILLIQHEKVILDSELAQMYGVCRRVA